MLTKTPRYSVLDLVPVRTGSDAGDALRTSLEMVQAAEELGYHRYWVAEHHNIAGIASAATAVVIGYLAGGTQRIRVGAGGVMLPNHAPLVVAEQFGTLESLYPGRIDLGLGRAPGSDGVTARALRRTLTSSPDSFPADVRELQQLFQPARPGQAVRAIPGMGLNVPLYLLGSSDFSARLAAQLGLPFAFASHFAPDYLHTALRIYHTEFQPSAALAAPYTIIGVNVFAADDSGSARRMLSSLQQRFLALARGRSEELQPARETLEDLWSPQEKAHIQRITQYSAVGTVDEVRARLAAISAETAASELMLSGPIYDRDERRHSLTLAAEAMQGLGPAQA